MARLTRPATDQRQGDDKPSWPQLIDKWLHNPLILFTLLTAFLALLTALVLIAGLAGAGLWTLLAAALYPTAKKLRNRISIGAGHTTTNDNTEQPPDSPPDEP